MPYRARSQRILRTLLSSVLIAMGCVASTVTPAQAAVSVTITNSDSAGGPVSRFDVNGNTIDAHDGSVMFVNGLYYLYGTSYACGYQYGINSTFCGFKVYSTPNLVNWTDQGWAVPPMDCLDCFRPHVVYNAQFNNYVMWADIGASSTYGVWTAPTPTGPFTRQAAPTLNVTGDVDMALFVDTDGTGYLLHNTVQVAAGLTADGVVEQLSPDYLTTVSGKSTRLGLGNVEAFTLLKRNGVYHMLMADPTCAYCYPGATGEMTATSMLGAWSGAFYDPNSTDWNGNAQPRWRGRLVNDTSCGGEPLAAVPYTKTDGTDGWLFMSDRWNDRHPNEALANFFIGPIDFDAAGVLQPISCVNSFSLSMQNGSAGANTPRPAQNQGSGDAGFRHFCDITSTLSRQQSFTPSSTGTLSSASVTSFLSNDPNAPLFLDVVASDGTVLATKPVPVSWGPKAVQVHPNVEVTAGQVYNLRLWTRATTGCYGFEYNDFNPYANGGESYNSNGGAFTNESNRDLKFTADVTPYASDEELPGGASTCATEGQACTFSGAARLVYYGAGKYFSSVLASGSTCGTATFGGDPTFGVLKSCLVAPAGGPNGYTVCAAENGTCTLSSGPRMVAYGQNGAFKYRLVTGSTPCTVAVFGDPIVGVNKSCYTAPSGAPAGWTVCAAENGTCTTTLGQSLLYGENGAFNRTTAAGSRANPGSTSCTNNTFGDPIVGVVKSCYIRTGPPVGYATVCASGGQQCSFSGFRTVAYGANGQFTYRSFTGGTPCGPAELGSDPLYGVAKACYLTP